MGGINCENNIDECLPEVLAFAPKVESEFKGCWKDMPKRDMKHRLPNFKFGKTDDEDDREVCFQGCRDAGYKYAGLQWYGQCFCDNDYGSYGEPIHDTVCECQPGSKKFTYWGNCVYDVSAGSSARSLASRPEFSKCKNNGVCHDLINAYECECPAGFEGEHCEINIDECRVKPCKNGSQCVDGINDYTCECRAGFEGKNCEINIDECATNPCQNQSRCVDGENDYECLCRPGFIGKNCETNFDECAAQPCQNGGTCTDGENAYTCACPAGFEGKDCEINIDECKIENSVVGRLLAGRP